MTTEAPTLEQLKQIAQDASHAIDRSSFDWERQAILVDATWVILGGVVRYLEELEKKQERAAKPAGG